MIIGNTGIPDYALLDSGGGEKLEQFGDFKIIRPDPRAIWQKSYSSRWEKADAIYKDEKWQKKLPVGEWTAGGMILKLTEFRHVGLFPEQSANWHWLQQNIMSNIRVLNLFAYTGGATMAAVQAGAHVTHVDASKPALMWASQNFKVHKLPVNKVRWMQDDAVKFVQREIRRGVFYDGIIMDPPRFGRGVGGEVWKIEENLPKLVDLCRQILTPNPLFWLINAYTADLSPIAIGQVLEDATRTLGGKVTYDELVIEQEENSQSEKKRFLPAGIVARWSKKI